MLSQTRVEVLGLVGEDTVHTEPLWDYLRSTRSIALQIASRSPLPDHLGAYQVIVIDDPARLTADDLQRVAASMRLYHLSQFRTMPSQ
jgi:hypothetical protein